MMNRLPGYAKYFFIIAGLAITCYIFILGKSILSPIFIAFIVALLLRPLSAKMEKIKMSRGLSSVLSIVIVIISLVGLSYFFSSQVGSISKEMNELGTKFNDIIDRGQTWLTTNLGIAEQQQTKYLKDSLNGMLSSSSGTVTSTISATAGFFTGFFLFIISLFFFLYYRRFLVSFIYKSFKDENHDQLSGTLSKIESVVRSYILGLIIVIFIVAVLNTIGLVSLGIPHAIFFGTLAAVLTVIPYIGIFIGSVLPIIFAFVTKDSLWYPVGVAIIFWVVQFLEGNFITPNIIGNKVSINPFAAIIALFVGGIIWGPVGMILSIPMLAIIKVIFDAIPSLQPYGFLLGVPPEEDVLEKKKKPRRFIRKKKVKQTV